MSIIGIDLSLSNTGIVCLPDKGQYISTLIKTKPIKTRKEETERLARICLQSLEFVEKQENVKLILIEGLSFASHKSVAVMQLAGLHYLVRVFTLMFPTVIVAPSTLKKFVTGNGNSHKDVMMMETFKKYKVTITNDNICDAYCLAQIGKSLLNNTLKLTQRQQEVIKLLSQQLKGN